MSEGDAGQTMNDSGGYAQAARLLLSVAEQLKLPLTSIARQAELPSIDATSILDAALIHAQATAALTLVDSYLLGVELLNSQTTLALEPVSVSSMLTEAAHHLDSYAKQYGVQLEVHMAGRYEPVMAHQLGLRAVLTSLGYALIEARAAQDDRGPKRLLLAGHRTAHGIITGIYGTQGLNRASLRTATTLYGTARQPFASLLGSSGAGVFVADALAQAMASKVQVGRHAKQAGLAITLLPSQQLQLI
jgi:hypothetical protein